MTEPLLSLKGLTKAYPGVIANNNVSFDIGAGEVHALLGENGAGKSTLVKMIYGLVKPDSGTMTLRGQPFAPPEPRAARASVRVAADIGSREQLHRAAVRKRRTTVSSIKAEVRRSGVAGVDTTIKPAIGWWGWRRRDRASASRHEPRPSLRHAERGKNQARDQASAGERADEFAKRISH